MKTRKLSIFGLLVLFISTTACINETIDGNGIPATEERHTQAFDKVKSSGSFEVYIAKGDNYAVTVSAEENVLPFIETYVSNGALILDIEDHTNIRNDIPMEIFITTPEISGIKQSGSGNINTDFFEADKMDLSLSGSGRIVTACDTRELYASISGSGRIEVAGNTESARFTISGSGNMEAADLNTESCYSRISGSGDVWISVDEYLEANISGSGNVFYYGDPEIKKSISGSGYIVAKN